MNSTTALSTRAKSVSMASGTARVDANRLTAGIMHMSNGDIYAGSWEDGLFEGYGTYILASGERYEGELDDGLK